MPLLLSCHSIAKSFGAQPLFREISLTISDGERVGLIGPNGSGKSTLLQILAGLTEPDSGHSSLRRGVKLGYVPQDSHFPAAATVDEVLGAILPHGVLEKADRSARLATTMGRAGFLTGEQRVESLSGGWKKRLAIACELLKEPDILLLDEPTNHLDIEGILWLEKLLKTASFASVVVSHDRYFLENVATHMMELDRVHPDGLFRVQGAYSDFLEKKDEFLHAQAKRQESLENKVRREVEWLRRGPKARTTKSKARIDAAGRMMEELSDLSARGRTASAGVDFTASDRQTKRLLEATGIAVTLGGRTLFAGLDIVLSPGKRIGLAGLNGSGKTTLLRILNGDLAPSAGTIERADNLQVVYFDQHREQLDPESTLRRALAPHGDSVIFRGRPIHVAAWARRFLFRQEQLDMPVSRLSGGEKARVLIARLMLRPADVLLLDEPTNDLDIPTLEVLEESLLDFPGALVLVSHDRYLLDRISTGVLGLDGEGSAEWFADYSQWEQFQLTRRQARPEKDASAEPRPAAAQPAPAQKKKLSYMENREWEQMEAKILEAEEALEARKAAIHVPDVVTDPARLQDAYRQLEEAQDLVDRLYARWAELEAKIT
ncbi:MAG: ABC-F family ATP-binding cassette domain-containing protein [Bryobacteraceae bacterium]